MLVAKKDLRQTLHHTHTMRDGRTSSDELAAMGISIPTKPNTPPPPPTHSMIKQRLSSKNSQEVMLGNNPTSSMGYEEDDDDGVKDLFLIVHIFSFFEVTCMFTLFIQ